MITYGDGTWQTLDQPIKNGSQGTVKEVYYGNSKVYPDAKKDRWPFADEYVNTCHMTYKLRWKEYKSGQSVSWTTDAFTLPKDKIVEYAKGSGNGTCYVDYRIESKAPIIVMKQRVPHKLSLYTAYYIYIATMPADSTDYFEHCYYKPLSRIVITILQTNNGKIYDHKKVTIIDGKGPESTKLIDGDDASTCWEEKYSFDYGVIYEKSNFKSFDPSGSSKFIRMALRDYNDEWGYPADPALPSFSMNSSWDVFSGESTGLFAYNPFLTNNFTKYDSRIIGMPIDCRFERTINYNSDGPVIFNGEAVAPLICFAYEAFDADTEIKLENKSKGFDCRVRIPFRTIDNFGNSRVNGYYKYYEINSDVIAIPDNIMGNIYGESDTNAFYDYLTSVYAPYIYKRDDHETMLCKTKPVHECISMTPKNITIHNKQYYMVI